MVPRTKIFRDIEFQFQSYILYLCIHIKYSNMNIIVDSNNYKFIIPRQTKSINQRRMLEDIESTDELCSSD